MGLTYGCVVPHSPNLVPEVGRSRSTEAQVTREAMEELAMLLGARGISRCVIVSPHSPFLPEAFGVWEPGTTTGSMARFQAPEVVVTLDVCADLADAIADVCERMELPVGRIGEGERLDRGVTVPAVYLFTPGQTQVVPVAPTMLGWDEHWLFGTAVALAAERLPGDTAIIASSNLSHRVTPDAPHGYTAAGSHFDARIRDAISSGQLRELLEMPPDLVREASECGFLPLLVVGGAFDGKSVSGRVISYEAPFGIGYLVAELTQVEAEPELAAARTGAAAEAGAEASIRDLERQLRLPFDL